MIILDKITLSYLLSFLWWWTLTQQTISNELYALLRGGIFLEHSRFCWVTVMGKKALQAWALLLLKVNVIFWDLMLPMDSFIYAHCLQGLDLSLVPLTCDLFILPQFYPLSSKPLVGHPFDYGMPCRRSRNIVEWLNEGTGSFLSLFPRDLHSN